MKLALAQIDICWENKTVNKVSCEALVLKASKQAADLILFPEMSLTGFSMDVNGLGEVSFGETTEWFRALAILYGIAIGFGFIQSSTSNSKGHNDYIVLDCKGNLLSTYSKIHPFSFGKESLYYEGGKDISIFNLNEFNISTFICYDLRFPEIFQIASKRASLITLAANWPEARIEHWETLLKARAIENQCYIAGVNRVGIGDGIKYCGHSLVIDPLGKIIAEGGNLEELIVCEINAENVYNIREEFKLKADRREELYKLL
jgi:predicted amidohydrolase